MSNIVYQQKLASMAGLNITKMRALGEALLAFVRTPIGTISAITMGIFLLDKAIDGLTTSWEEEIEAAQEAIEVNEENITKYKDEIDSLEELQNKLQEARGDKKALAAIQIELNSAIGATPGLLNGEAAAHEIATQKIKDQIQATKDLLKVEQQSLIDNNTAIFNNNGIKKEFLGIDFINPDASGEDMREIIKDYYEDYNNFISQGLSAEEAKEKARMIQETRNNINGSAVSISEEEWQQYWNAQVKSALEIFESTISSYDGFGGSEFIRQIIEKSVRAGNNLEEIEAIIKQIQNSPIQSLINEYYESLSDPNADSDLAFANLTEELNRLKEQYPELSDILDLYSKHIADNLNNISNAAEDAETSFKSIAQTLSDSLDKLSNKKDILSEVKEELDSFGAISADNISKILEEFSDNDDVQKAVAYYLSGIGTAQQLYDVMAKGYQNDLQLQAEKLSAQMQNDENYYKSLVKLHGDFAKFEVGNQTINLSNCKNLADAKLRVENALINTLKENWKGYWSASSKSIQDEYRRVNQQYRRITNAGKKVDPQFKQYYDSVVAAYQNYNTAISELDKISNDTFTTSGFNASLNTDFNKSSGKTEAEKYFAKLKYNLETNKITEQQYLKSLDAAYKKYYSNKSKYLEEFEQYSQEVYDGFKDMYKEDLETQKEAWEEKKDAVSEYYDNLREQIEDAHDKEDYEKEQSEKRKEIFDLDMQIAELMRDGSEKAKARIAELEEERLKAEEELLDFETDKAREDELSRLEKEQEAEEKKIQDKIDGIQDKLDKLDEDTISVRNAIVAYAKQKGVTLSFAYASGTRSSVGGFGRINEKGIEMISAPDGNGNYIPMLPNSYVFSAKATEFLWKLATEHSLPQAMYNSIAKSIKTQSSTPSVNIAQPITITMGDVIIKGNADKQTVAGIKKQQENTVRMVLQKIKELQK